MSKLVLVEYYDNVDLYQKLSLIQKGTKVILKKIKFKF